MLCLVGGERCGRSEYYDCKQIKAKMLVGHTEPVLEGNLYNWRVRNIRNITINIGCSCVYREPVLWNEFSQGHKAAGSRHRSRERDDNLDGNSLPQPSPNLQLDLKKQLFLSYFFYFFYSTINSFYIFSLVSIYSVDELISRGQAVYTPPLSIVTFVKFIYKTTQHIT
jgi:hypothetical protein